MHRQVPTIRWWWRKLQLSDSMQQLVIDVGGRTVFTLYGIAGQHDMIVQDICFDVRARVHPGMFKLMHQLLRLKAFHRGAQHKNA